MGAFDTVTGWENEDWTTCGFTSGLEHDDLKGSKAAVRINDEFRSSRDWQILMHLASSKLKSHEPVYQNPMLAIRKENVLGKERDVGEGEPAVAKASALSEEMLLRANEWFLRTFCTLNSIALSHHEAFILNPVIHFRV
jgi:hypothetical protein